MAFKKQWDKIWNELISNEVRDSDGCKWQNRSNNWLTKSSNELLWQILEKTWYFWKMGINQTTVQLIHMGSIAHWIFYHKLVSSTMKINRPTKGLLQGFFNIRIAWLIK